MSDNTEQVKTPEEPKVEEKPKETPHENGTTENKEETKENEPAPKDMRAIVLTGFGGLKTVKVMKKPEPTLQEGEVLIRVKACGLNFQDLMVRLGAIDSPPKCPFILGFECAGEIEQVGEGVEGFKVGDKVVALPEFRAWAELVAVPAKYVFHLPENMTPMDAATIAMNYVVAHILLFDYGGLSSGKSVLLHSAGGGVGQAVAQLCRTVPDVTVFGVCSKGKHEALKTNESPIDHLLERGSDYSGEVRKISPDGVDIVLDCLCGEEVSRGYQLLKPMGRYILYGSSNIVTGETKSFFSAARSWWQVDKVSPIKLFDDNKSLAGFNLRHLLFQQGKTEYIHRAMEKVFKLWSEGKIKPVVDSTWALEDVAEAMQKMHDRKNVGKIVMDPSMEPKPKPATPAKGKNKEDKKKQSSTEEKEKDKDSKKEEEKKEEDKDKKEEKKEELTNGSSDNADSGKKSKK